MRPHIRGVARVLQYGIALNAYHFGFVRFVTVVDFKNRVSKMFPNIRLYLPSLANPGLLFTPVAILFG